MTKEDNRHSTLAKVVLILGLVLLGLIIFAIFKENYKKKEAQSQIDELQEEAEKITRENSELSEKLSYLESREYQEKEARDKLNMQNAKENMVIVEPGVVTQDVSPDTDNADTKKLTVKKTNLEKWWDYFFLYQ